MGHNKSDFPSVCNAALLHKAYQSPTPKSSALSAAPFHRDVFSYFCIKKAKQKTISRVNMLVWWRKFIFPKQVAATTHHHHSGHTRTMSNI